VTIAQRSATKRNRQRQQRAERRLDEIVQVASIADDYALADRRGDLEIEARFQELYNLVDSPAEKEAVARAFAVHQRTEQNEERAVVGSVGESVDLLKAGNDFWLGSWTPSGEGDAA
jgi:hypothetical protein